MTRDKRNGGWSMSVAVSVAMMIALLGPLAEPSAPQEAGRGWLALGDSYSSGEGIPGTTADPDTSGINAQGRDCRRATGVGTEATAWSVGAYNDIGRGLGFDQIALVACTGAVTTGLASQITEAQTRLGRDRWDLVTFSIGGNDILFEDVLTGCLDLNSVWGLFDLSPGCDIPENELRARIDSLRTTLAGVYDDVADVVVPGGDVVVAGYQQLIEEGPSVGDRIARGDRRFERTRYRLGFSQIRSR